MLTNRHTFAFQLPLFSRYGPLVTKLNNTEVLQLKWFDILTKTQAALEVLQLAALLLSLANKQRNLCELLRHSGSFIRRVGE